MQEFIKKFSKKIYVFSFILALIIGITSGVLIGNGRQRVVEPDLPKPSGAGPDFYQSNNIKGLLLGVDDLNIDTPTLESAWWLSYDQENYQFQLMPLYPIIPINAPENLLKYLSPHNPIIFSSPEISTIKHHEMFSSYNLSWDFTLLMDRYALDQMLESYSNLSADSSSLKIEYLNSLTPSLPGKDPSAALSYQRKLFEILCEDPAPILTETWIINFTELSLHFRTDLDLKEILILRENIQINSIIPSCKFSWQ